MREAFERVDVAAVIDLLEPLTTTERLQRLQEVLDGRLESVTVVLDAPHDPHNGAAVLRSCDAFGVQHVHVVERTEPFSASRAVAKGTQRWIDVSCYDRVEDAVRALTESGHALIGTHPKGALTPEQLAGFERLALVMGNEHDGISDQLAAACTDHVRIPMQGFVESLNVSVSAAILLHAATRGRAGDLSANARRRLYARWLTLSVPRGLDVLDAAGIRLSSV